MENNLIEKAFPYQLVGADWLSKKPAALLGDEMRLGKSAQAIIAADTIKAKRVLVVCPAVARENWINEFNLFSKTKRNHYIIYDSKPPSLLDKDLVIISAALVGCIDFKCLGIFDLVILDEVHYFKNTQTKRTQAIFGKRGIVHEQIAQNKSCKVWALSGTPAPNHAGELWPLLYTFGVTNLGYQAFIERFCVLTQTNFRGKIQSTISGTKRSAIPELRGLLAKIMLRRTQKEVGSQLPPVRYSTVVVEEGDVDLSSESSFVQYVFPENRVAELEAKLKEEVALIRDAISTNNLEILKGLAKSVSTLRRYIGCQKVEKTSELITMELLANPKHKIVIFAIHRDVIEGLRVRLKDFNPVTLYNGTRFDSAHKHLEKFKSNPKCRVFIGNIIAAGIAIDLSAANDVVFIEQDWVPGNNAQAAARCGGPRQTKPVSVRFISLANSLDEKVAQILKRKTEELTEIFDAAKSSTSSLQGLEDLLS